jgi:hypothetical protein
MGPNFRFASRAHLRVCVQIANSRALSDAEAYSLPGRVHYPSPDFRTGLSRTTTFRDLIPVWRLFVFNGTTVRYPLSAGFPGRAGKGARAVLRNPVDLPKSQVAACLPGPLRAVCGRPGPAGGRRCRLAARPGCGPRRRAGNRTRAAAPPASGYASLCWPASVPAVRSRAVWGRQGDWLSGRALRSHRRGRWFEPSIAHQPTGAAGGRFSQPPVIAHLVTLVRSPGRSRRPWPGTG